MQPFLNQLQRPRMQAPEVFRGLPYNEKVDVFSFGVLVYEVFSRTLTLIAGVRFGAIGREAVQRSTVQLGEGRV